MPGRSEWSGKRYGEHGDLVTAFLDEVAVRSLDEWRALGSGGLGRSLERTAAIAVLVDADIPEPARAAVSRAADRAYGALGLQESDFGSPYPLGRVRTGISTAAMAIAAGDRLEARSRELLLRPFADAGFVSAAAALAKPAMP
ncbi:hypothetical protein [Microbacterium marinilacus]|uniref:DUF222 domain-containing protein n=1 Tax=Microbacterium marinilacus TaxID=415209 RepID=A0ABP7BGR3_9MICO|nr:hypothetical protein [Microbacterium marinilacus]